MEFFITYVVQSKWLLEVTFEEIGSIHYADLNYQLFVLGILQPKPCFRIRNQNQGQIIFSLIFKIQMITDGGYFWRKWLSPQHGTDIK